MRSLQENLLEWFGLHGRHALPWRATRDPYRILVSEFMLQQTQVDRVSGRYEAFIARFPSALALAHAATADVVREWKGLGYNSRAVRLQRIARMLIDRFAGVMPLELAELLSLPGVGAYTAAALRVFAFGKDDLAVDTNIRRVMHRILYGIEYPPAVADAELKRRAVEMIPAGRTHEWNSALMDLGATVCTARAPKCLLCPVRRNCLAGPVDAGRLEHLRLVHTKKRSATQDLPFGQTTRFARGRIVDRLRELPPGARISFLDLKRDLQGILPQRTFEGIEKTLGALERDGIVRRHGESFALSD